MVIPTDTKRHHIRNRTQSELKTATNTYQQYYAINQFFVHPKRHETCVCVCGCFGVNLFWQLLERTKENKRKQQPLDLLELFIAIYKYYRFHVHEYGYKHK